MQRIDLRYRCRLYFYSSEWIDGRLRLIEVRDKAEADEAALMDAGYLSVQG